MNLTDRIMRLSPEYMKMRNELFQRLPVEDWNTIINFEQIVINYIKINQALKLYENN